MNNTDNGKTLESVMRKTAKSGKVSYSEPVTVHKTSKTKIELIPFYIKRSNGTELSVKICSYNKNKSVGWLEDKKKSITLNKVTIRNFIRETNKLLKVAEQDTDGDYIIIKVEDGTAKYTNIDAASVAKSIISVLSQKGIVEHIKATELNNEIVSAFKGLIRLKEMNDAIIDLKQHLNNNEYNEQIYQEWCLKHSWAFGSSYLLADEVRNISPTDKLDLLLPKVLSGYRDIVELKRPNMKVLIYDDTHRNFYFSSEVSKALGQVQRYMDVFQEVAKNGLRDYPEVVSYFPRTMIVIGRSNKWSESEFKALHGLNSRLIGISIMTYDQLLEQGERLLEIYNSDTKDINEITENGFLTVDEDDLPF